MVRWLTKALLLGGLMLPMLAHAQVGTPNQCGPTSVGASAVAVVFPASGTTGNAFPTRYLTIANPSAAATLWVNPLPGGTAAANTAGSIEISPGAILSWNQPNYPAPATLSIIASAGATPVTCLYQ